MISVRNKKWLEKYLGIKISPETKLRDLIFFLAKKVAKLDNSVIKVIKADKNKIEVIHGAPESVQLSNPAMPGKGGE